MTVIDAPYDMIASAVQIGKYRIGVNKRTGYGIGFYGPSLGGSGGTIPGLFAEFYQLNNEAGLLDQFSLGVAGSSGREANINLGGALGVLDQEFADMLTWSTSRGYFPYGYGPSNGIIMKGQGFAPIYGLDNRSGVTVADGSPIVLYAVPAGANQLFDAAIEIDATAFTSGTATYTMTYTENGVAQTIVVTATVLNVVTGVRRLIQPDALTNVTVQLTGPFVATCRLSAALMQLA